MTRRPSRSGGPRPGWRRHGWWIGAILGVAGGISGGLWVQDAQEAREAEDVDRRARVFHSPVEQAPPPNDTVRELLAQDGRVVVDPLLADRVSEADLAEAEEALESAEVPGRLAFVRYPVTLDEGYTNTGLLGMWVEASGEEGHYVVLFDNGGTQVGALGLEEPFLDARSQGQPGPALVRIAEEMATWEAEPLPDEPDPPSDQDYWGGIGGGIGALVLFGGFGVVPAFLLLRWWVGRRRTS